MKQKLVPYSDSESDEDVEETTNEVVEGSHIPSKRSNIRYRRYFVPVVEELKMVPKRTVNHSFYTKDWIFEFKDIQDEELFKTNTPAHNVSILHKRLTRVFNHLWCNLGLRRNVYIGKTTAKSIAKKMFKHVAGKKFVIMVTLQKFTTSHIPSNLLIDWNLNLNTFVLMYENLLLEKIRERDEFVLDNVQDYGGGGMKSSQADEVCLYALFGCK